MSHTSNFWLLAEITFSLLLHFFIVYSSFFASTLGISPHEMPQEVLEAAPLSTVVVPAFFYECDVTLLCSFSFIIIDEAMKSVACIINNRTKLFCQK